MAQFQNYSAQTGITEKYEFFVDGKHHVQYSQDCQHLVDYAQRMRDHQFAGNHGFFQAVAEIPATVWMQWCKADGVDLMDGEAIDRCITRRVNMNDPEFAKLSLIARQADPHIVIKGLR